jgi:hypothetical protein
MGIHPLSFNDVVMGFGGIDAIKTLFIISLILM